MKKRRRRCRLCKSWEHMPRKGARCRPCKLRQEAKRHEQAAQRLENRANAIYGMGPEPVKLKIAPFLDRHVTYLHHDGKTWERVPMQIFSVPVGDPQERLEAKFLRIGRNTYHFMTVTWAEAWGKVRRGGSVMDSQRASPETDRKALLEANFGNEDKHWPSRPLLRKKDWGYEEERAEWKAAAKRERSSQKAWKKRETALKRHQKRNAKKRRKWAREDRERAKMLAGEGRIVLALRPLLLGSSRSLALSVYRALANNVWKSLTDGKFFHASMRGCGRIVAALRDQNEHYGDYYCAPGEGRVSRRVRKHMKEYGWVLATKEEEEKL